MAIFSAVSTFKEDLDTISSFKNFLKAEVKLSVVLSSSTISMRKIRIEMKIEIEVKIEIEIEIEIKIKIGMKKCRNRNSSQAEHTN